MPVRDSEHASNQVLTRYRDGRYKRARIVVRPNLGEHAVAHAEPIQHLDGPCRRLQLEPRDHQVALHDVITDTDEALVLLRPVIDGGFFCYATLAADPWLDSLRDTPEFRGLLQQARTRSSAARQAFVAAGGDEILG